MSIITAARWMGVAPWDLAEREDGEYWTEWATFLMDVASQPKSAGTKNPARARKGGKR